MNKRFSAVTLAAILGLVILPLASACKKKAPTTAQDARPPVTAAKPTETNVPPPPKPAPTTDVEAVDITVMDIETLNKKGYLNDAFFDFDQADLREDARSVLAADAQWLKKHASVQVLIEGHCDERGTAAYNLALGDRRANAAKEYLVSLGIDASRIKTISYGKERPFCTESNETCWQKNRRAHLVITAK
ncbi:MAG TPA: peptidoglycan-associated lipoprotein Pal [Thermoanaerobaculia bacterium]|nr:peptidoglycan-associated lipoprotein Pal [Thermoanaerobaculia bacterium]